MITWRISLVAQWLRSHAFQCRGHWLYSWSGNKIPHTTTSQINKKKYCKKLKWNLVLMIPLLQRRDMTAFAYLIFLPFVLSDVWAPKGASQVALVVKNPPANAGDIRDVGAIPGLGRSPGGGHGNLLQYSCLENPMDRGTWQVESMGTQRVRHLSTHARNELWSRELGGWGTMLAAPSQALCFVTSHI